MREHQSGKKVEVMAADQPTDTGMVVVMECDGTDRQTVPFNPERAEGYWLARVEELAAQQGVEASDISLRFSKAPVGQGWVR